MCPLTLVSTVQISGITLINALSCTHVLGTLETGVMCSGFSSISVNKRRLTKERVTPMTFHPLMNLLLSVVLIFFFFRGATVPSGPGPSHYRGFTITFMYTTLGMTPLDE